MRSIFDAPAFGARGFVSYAPPSLGTVRLAQAPEPDSADVGGLKSGIEDILKQLPPDVLGAYDAKYKDCLAKIDAGGVVGVAAGGKCLAELYAELKDFMKNGPKKAAPVAPPPAAPFPVLPAAFGVVALIVLVWGLSKL